MSKYITSWLTPLIVVLAIVAFSQGGWYLWAPLLAELALFILGDAILPKDHSEPALRQSLLLNLPCYVILPLLAIMNLVVLWIIGTDDPAGFGAWLQSTLHIDLFAARADSHHWAMWLGAILSAALTNAAAGTVAGHELIHRTNSRFDLFMGRWMLAFTADTSFAIEHVYGHHARVATLADPATARRGESYYAFTLRSTVFSYIHAYQLEKGRLAKLSKSIWNPMNSPFMRGNLENLAFFIAAYAVAGGPGLALWIAVALIGKQFLEMTNYFEHYGLVREPGQPVEPRHSWNSNHWMSSHVLFSLARHSHHHAAAELPYWKLRAYPNAPMLPLGYLTMIVVALVPPLFKKLMDPALKNWDEKHATAAERQLLKQSH